MTHTWNLLQGGCACMMPDAGGQDATGQDAAPSDAGSFACGPDTCSGATQYCLIQNRPHSDAGPAYSCEAADGALSCSGMSMANAPGDCGCYESPSGQITITTCPP
jgi:hypothetical protein